jgi:hypothetical protein
MSARRSISCLSLALLASALAGVAMKSASPAPPPPPERPLVVGRNVNMVAGTGCIDGDPYLQRQNEPSAAVSTRNALHLIAGANDYRAVDMPQSEGPLPGIPEGAAAGDAWLGLFKSFNGGESWISTLLPGYPQDTSVIGRSSPLYGLSAASDPTVRAGTNGLFYYSGIAFDRVARGRSVIFVARFIDNNFTRLGDTDPIEYLDTRIIDQGTAGQFADKPWIAVAAPRNGSGTVPISAPDTPVQDVARHDVYMAYSVFLGSAGGGDMSKIMFARSDDCGTTWQSPIKVSESHFINQGTTIAVSPKDGTILLAWRRFASASEPSAILVSQSRDFGATFTKGEVVATVNAFDQMTAPNRFRTYAFPSLTVDKDGVVYVAWSERGLGPAGDARIVVATSTNGTSWTAPQPVDNHGGRGHQIMPSLTFAAGRLTMTWYDLRRSEGGFGIDISDPGPTGKSHTMDVWAAQARPSLDPDFSGSSTKVSKYLHGMEKGADGTAAVVQKEASHANDRLFDGGTKPFMGDYMDVVPAPRFLFDVNVATQTGYWRFNTEDSDPGTSFVAWTDNRDVRPGDGVWTNYTPPSSPCSSAAPAQCNSTSPGTTGKRNQNIYVSPITRGLMVGAPVNTKPLFVAGTPTDPARPQKRTFLIFVKNVTEGTRQVQLTIEKPVDMDASFWEEWPVPEDDWPCPFLSCERTQIAAEIAPYSALTLTVFVAPYEADPYATFRVKVEDVGGAGAFTDYIVLNPDPENTRIVPAVEEYHTPDYVMEAPALVNFADPTVLSEQIVYLPDLSYIVENVNPDIVAPTFRSPTLRSGDIVNPTYRSSSIGDISGGTVTDLQWRITNNNDAASAYSFIPIGYAPTLPDGAAYQLLIYRVSTTPAAGAATAADPDLCKLYQEEHHELILKVESPTFRSPTFRSPTYRSPTFRSPTFRSNTFSLAPGEEAVCTLRFIEPPEGPSVGEGTVQNGPGLMTADPPGGFDPHEYAKTVAGSAVAQAANPDGQIYFASSLYIIDKPLPAASVNDVYAVPLEAFGGEPVTRDDRGTSDPGDDICTYDGKWTPATLFYATGDPSGLSVDINGMVSGTPLYYSGVAYPQVLSFMAEVTDNSAPPQIARRELTITVACILHPVKVTAGPFGEICSAGPACVSGGISGGSAFVSVPHGGSLAFAIVPYPCFDVAVVTVKKGGVTIFSERAVQYTMADVRSDDYEIEASFRKISYLITARTEATPPSPPGGTIVPAGDMLVECGASITFTISPDEGYLVADVTDNGVSQGPQTTYTIANVAWAHEVIARFRAVEAWVKRYNNGAVNGDDQARAVAVHRLSGKVLVTGYSTGKTTGADIYTTSYDGDGLQGWSGRYDGPSHLGDYANAVVADAAGNTYVGGYVYRGNVVKHADYATLKYDPSGKLVWTAQYDDRRNGNDEITAMTVDPLNFVYVTGRSEDSQTKDDVLHYDYYTIKYDPNTGKAVWAARYNSTLIAYPADEASGIAVDAAGNVYVTGRSRRSPADFDCVTVKYSAVGIEQWVRRYDGGHGDDEAAGIAVDAAGNVYVTGRSRGAGTGFDCVTIKYDPSGVEQWVKRDDNVQGDDEAAAIAVDNDGHVFVTGRSQGSGTGFDYITLKYDAGSGSPLWASRYDHSSGADEAVALALDASGNVYVTGRSQASGTGFDYLTVKYSGLGKPVWRARYNNPAFGGADEAAAIALDASGNVYVTGRSQGGPTGFDYATVKYKGSANGI